MEGFLAAVAAHNAWYRGKGVMDLIFATPVIVGDETKQQQSYSTKQFLTFHLYSKPGDGPRHDDAYDAFVKLYRENSDIKSEYTVCMPK